MGKHTSSTRLVTEKTLELFDRITDSKLLVRRLNITANHIVGEDEVIKDSTPQQLSLFDDVEEIERRQAQEQAAEEKERRIQQAMIQIKGRFGANAILKGTNFQEGATARERNQTIGGHKA